MFKVVVSNRFSKDLKLAHKRGLDLEQLNIAVNILAAGKKLEKRYRDHELTGEFAGFRECRIHPDWLLIYRIEQDELELFLFRPVTHSDLF